MIKLIKYFLYTLFIPFWWVQKLIPRDKNIWVFGAWYGEKYSDNAKVLFDYVNANNNSVNAIWLTKRKEIVTQLRLEGRNSYTTNSIQGVFYLLMASKVIFSSGKVDLNRFFTNGAIHINTWHGAPMKKIGLDDKFAKISTLKRIILQYIYPFIWEFNVDYVVSTAEIFNKKLSSAFNVPDNNIILSGYPRCDLLFEKELHPLTIKWNGLFDNPRKIFYLPTFRSDNERFTPFNSFGFDEIAWEKYLQTSNSILISKGHFVDKHIGNPTTVERIIHISDNDVSELNTLLKDVDILITDYSGVFFDFLLTNKPIILAPFDIDTYLSKSRELYFEYEDFASNSTAYNWKEVLKLLNDNKFGNVDEYKSQKLYFNKFCQGGNSKRLMNYINNL